MKKLIMLMGFVLLLGTVKTIAQEDDIPIDDRVESMRISIYTYVLNLSPEEAKLFWPVFNKYQGELQKIKQEEKKIKKDVYVNIATMSDKDIENAIDRLMSYEEQEVQLKRKYIEEFKKVISVRKVLLLPKAETEFKRALLKEINNRKKGR